MRPSEAKSFALFPHFCVNRQLSSKHVGKGMHNGLWTQKDGFGLICLEFSPLTLFSLETAHNCFLVSVGSHWVYLKTFVQLTSASPDCLINPLLSLFSWVLAQRFSHYSLYFPGSYPNSSGTRWLTKQGLPPRGTDSLTS